MTTDDTSRSPSLGGQQREGPTGREPGLSKRYFLHMVDRDGLMTLTWDDILSMGPEEEDKRIEDLKLLSRYGDGSHRESLFYRYLAGLAYPPGTIGYERERAYQEYREAVEDLKEVIAETFYPALDIAVKVANWLGIK